MDISGNLNPKNNGALNGSFIQFDQSKFIADPTSHGMDDRGWLLNKYTVDQIKGKRFDPDSIMLYFSPGTWVKGGIGRQSQRGAVGA